MLCASTHLAGEWEQCMVAWHAQAHFQTQLPASTRMRSERLAIYLRLTQATCSLHLLFRYSSPEMRGKSILACLL